MPFVSLILVEALFIATFIAAFFAVPFALRTPILSLGERLLPTKKKQRAACEPGHVRYCFMQLGNATWVLCMRHQLWLAVINNCAPSSSYTTYIDLLWRKPALMSSRPISPEPYKPLHGLWKGLGVGFTYQIQTHRRALAKHSEPNAQPSPETVKISRPENSSKTNEQCCDVLMMYTFNCRARTRFVLRRCCRWHLLGNITAKLMKHAQSCCWQT